MKPKRQRAIDRNKVHLTDLCQTPSYALDPILPFLCQKGIIWEPAAGEGFMATVLRRNGLNVITSDIQTGQNFFTYHPDQLYNLIVTNPPYGSKYPWIERCYALGVPFALLVPVETIGAGRAQRLMERYGFEMMLLNRRINFKMPLAGWTGSGAQFPVLWFCHNILPSPVMFGHIEYTEQEEIETRLPVQPNMVTLPLFE
jgi:hypothetical protein